MISRDLMKCEEMLNLKEPPQNLVTGEKCISSLGSQVTGSKVVDARLEKLANDYSGFLQHFERVRMFSHDSAKIFQHI